MSNPNASTPTADLPALHNLPAGTRVVSTLDGEDGSVLNGYASDPAAGGRGERGVGGWTEYEVVTADGIEIWKTGEFIVLDADGRAAGDC